MKVNMSQVLSQFDAMIEDNGSPAEFWLRDGQTTFTIQASDIGRVPADMTEGLQQDREVMRVMATRWHKVAGRDRRPEKGDQVIVGGKRYAIESARLRQFQGTPVGYVLVLRG